MIAPSMQTYACIYIFTEVDNIKGEAVNPPVSMLVIAILTFLITVVIV